MRSTDLFLPDEGFCEISRLVNSYTNPSWSSKMYHFIPFGSLLDEKTVREIQVELGSFTSPNSETDAWVP